MVGTLWSLGRLLAQEADPSMGFSDALILLQTIYKTQSLLVNFFLKTQQKSFTNGFQNENKVATETNE